MATRNTLTGVTTNEIRISYEHLTRAYSNQPGQELRYSITMLIPKRDAQTKMNIDRATQAAVQEGIEKKWGGRRPPQISLPIYDGDGVRPNGEAFSEECRGHWVMTASSRTQPEVRDLAMMPITEPTEIYSGMYARVYINFFAYDKNGKRGIGCGLGPVQKTRDGEPLAGRVSAEEAFGPATGYPQTTQAYPQQGYAPQPAPQQAYNQPQQGYAPQTYQQPVYAQPAPQIYQQPAPQQTYQQPQQPQPAYDPITGQPL